MGRRDILDEHLGLKCVYVPRWEEPTIDIVAVHGKGAHPAHTWGALPSGDLDPRDPANYLNWLTDDHMLPAVLPTARVLRYGYLSEWFGENALHTRAASIGAKLLEELHGLRLDAIDRPLIFVGHSFGGLVIVKCILQAKQEEWRYQNVVNSIVGLVFLGTPFRGTHDMLHTEILHNVQMLFQDSQVMYENHRASKADNDWLRDLLDDFFRLLRQGQMPKIACFYEEKPTDLGLFLKNKAGYVHEPGKYAVMHVDESSACLDRTSPSIEKYARACDHLSMNKFASANHPEWLALARVLQDMEQQETWQSPPIFPALSLASQAAFDTQNKQDEPDCLPGTRTDVLNEIKDWVTDADAPSIFWLSGTAGVGKSTIARTVSRYLQSKGLLGASFFFSRDGGEALSRARLLYTTIANQLAQAGPAELRRHIRKAAETNRDVLEKGRVFQWTNLILNPLKSTKTGGRKIIRAIVIDALDECEDESDIRGLIPLLARVNEAVNFQIRILVVSRPDPPIRNGFGEINKDAMHPLSLDEQNTDIVNSDIRLYLTDRFRTIKRQQSISEHKWPEVRSISRLVRLSAGLFIYAATACDFVQDDIDRNAEASLAWLLDEMERTEQESSPSLPNDNDNDMEHTAHLDQMYTRILQNSLREGKDEKKKNRLAAYLKDLLGAVVALREPLAAGTLQRLRQVNGEDVRWRLNRLQSVIRIPRTDDAPLRLSHIAFRDFLLDARRCLDKRFVLNPQDDHRFLFDNCMKLLIACLRRDMCDVRHPAALTRKLQISHIDNALPRWLTYACKSWISHVILSGRLDVIEPVHGFLKQHLLHWLEAMGWIGQSQQSTHMLARLYAEFGGLMIMNFREICEFFKDAHRFALFSQAILESAPLQVYCSALLFAPQLSLVRKHFQSETCPWVEECGNRELDWDDCLQILRTPFSQFGTGVMALSKDVRLVATATPEGLIEVWNSSNNETHELAGLPSYAVALTFSHDNKMLAACCQSEVCCIWNVSNGYCMRTTTTSSQPSAVAFSRDGLTVAMALLTRTSLFDNSRWDSKFVLWDVMTGEQAEREGAEIAFSSEKSSISPDLRVAAFPSGNCITLVTIPELGERSSKRLLLGHERAVGGATFSPDSTLLASACPKTIRVWDVATGQCKVIIQTGYLGSDDTPPGPIFSPDGGTIAARFRRATSTEHYIGLWRTEDGTERKEFAIPYTDFGFANAFAPDGESLAVLSGSQTEGKSIVLTTWDTLATSHTGEPGSPGKKTPQAIAVSEGGQLVATAYGDGLFELWSIRSGDAVAKRLVSWQEGKESGFTDTQQLYFSLNGKRLAYEKTFSSEDSDPWDNVRVRDTETGEALPPSAWDDDDMAGMRIGAWPDGFRRVISDREGEILPFTIPVAGSWLCFNAKPMLLLPSQCKLHDRYRGTGLRDVEGNTAVLALASGRFSVLRFHPSKMLDVFDHCSAIPLLGERRNKLWEREFYWVTTSIQEAK